MSGHGRRGSVYTEITEADVVALVKKWRTKLNIQAGQLPVATMLALVDYESGFAPWIIGEGGAHGLLQHFQAAAAVDSVYLYKEIKEEYWTLTGKSRLKGPPKAKPTRFLANVLIDDLVGGPNRQSRTGADKAAGLLRSAELSIAMRMATWKLPHLVAKHGWHPGLIAVYHHDGGGGLDDFHKIEKAMGNRAEAIAFVRSLFPNHKDGGEPGSKVNSKAAVSTAKRDPKSQINQAILSRRSADIGVSDFVCKRTKTVKKKNGKTVTKCVDRRFNPATENGRRGIELMGPNFRFRASPKIGIYLNTLLGKFDKYAKKRLSQDEIANSERFIAAFGRGVTATETQSRPLSENPGIASDQTAVVFNNGSLEGASRAILSYYMTPEELRKGIIGQVFHITDWHLNIVVTELSKDENKSESTAGKDPGPAKTASEADQNQQAPGQVAAKKAEATANKDSDTSEFTRNLSTAFASNASTLAVDRYIISLVDAEFYRRRYRSRSVPAVPGPFNPFPVAGFPGLLLNPDRPILGYISQISHTIDPQSATGSTTVSMSAPRYWDEGEVWYWFGGWNADNGVRTGTSTNIVSDEDYTLYRRFPQWHNHYCVATNNYFTEEDFRAGKNRRVTDLDRFYRFMLGCDAVDYMSNHYDRVGNPTVLKDLIVQKKNVSTVADVSFDLSPATLAVVEKNRLIAEIDPDSKKFAEGTLARRFWGAVKPHQAIEAQADVEEAIHYNRRFGVREYELLSLFLDNSWRKTAKGGGSPQRGVYVGPTFANNTDESGNLLLNPLQKQILTYMDDIEMREAGGGT